MNCKNCGKVLTGKKVRYCSNSCKYEDYKRRDDITFKINTLRNNYYGTCNSRLRFLLNKRMSLKLKLHTRLKEVKKMRNQISQLDLMITDVREIKKEGMSE